MQSIPKGKVVSYGQVAAACGSPRSARQVGGILRSLDSLPWWRVVNAKGFLSIRGNWEADKDLQKNLLEQEGMQVSKEFTLDMSEYQWSQDKG